LEKIWGGKMQKKTRSSQLTTYGGKGKTDFKQSLRQRGFTRGRSYGGAAKT